MFGFAVLVASVERHKYRTCDQAPYCARDKYVSPQNWTIDPSKTKQNSATFLAVVKDGAHDTESNLRINFLKSGGIHFKFQPSEKETFNRFDCSSEEIIVKQDKVSEWDKFEYEEKGNSYILKSLNRTVIINIAPFSMTFEDADGKVIKLNPDDNAIFEHHLSKEKYPDLYNPNDFGGFHDTFPNGPTSVAFNFRYMGNNTRISGLPVHTLPLTLPQSDSEMVRLFNSDINKFEVNNGMAMYAAIPFLMAHGPNHRSGIFWANPSETWINITYNEEYAETRIISEGGYIDFYIFSGTYNNIIDSYTQLTSRPMLPARFTLAYHQCRWGYMTQDDFMDVSRALDEEHLPHDVMWLDLDHADDRKYFTFHPTNFPDPAGMLSEFAKSKRHVVTLVDPHLKADTSYYVYKQASSKKLTIRTKDGSEFIGNCWPGRSAWPDFLNPEARAWWETQYQFGNYKHSAKNLHTWNDMNEISVFDSADTTAPRDLVHHNGIEEREVHNIYGALMVSATFGGLTKRSPEGERPFILTRSMFAGSQRYTFTWAGDNTGDWANLANTLQIVLSTSVAGFSLTGNDVGGFFDSPTDELLSRWYSVAAWTSPFFREHCHHLSARREINHVSDEKAKALIRESTHDRYRLLPYWYTLARQHNLTGRPILRPMWWEFDLPEYLDVDDYAMLGPALLVMPFVREGATSKDVVVPPGRWYNYRTMQPARNGPQQLPYDSGRTAVFLRGGCIVPSKDIVRKSSALMYYDPFTLSIGLDERGMAEGELYEDDGESLSFAKGIYIHRHFAYDGRYLNSTAVGQSTAPQNYDVTVNRIVIGGLGKPPSVVQVGERKLEFTYSNGVLVIKKPEVLIAEDWQIHIE